MVAAYDPGNIFARILRGEIPCHRVFEDDDVLAFMDVMPQCDGHTLVIPKVASRNVLDADPAVLAAIMPKVQIVARAVVSAFGADGMRLIQYNEAAAGQTVFHLHFHILPIKDGVPLRAHTGQMADMTMLAGQAARVREALAMA